MVIGIPRLKWGESIRAIIVARKDTLQTEEGFIDHCRRHLTSHKNQRSETFVDELPDPLWGQGPEKGLE
ncbi:MAG: hypothetical protein JRJ09_01720 [Deltaproteobacteria bacterium]|nr:hypothetical protein [Deltaproteobacteria bacterium]MBW2047234.1 hypothetical protein [Deltaproteobacteria bacterium]MBW2109954.1 hypothetical protein [Deltaproteobacteria bacterium]MBW2352304.1 hypothetical protein [Deltaproteobacteria bacterium]HDZ91922.1 hypothetical protein [Deltaproteobacteria bacterium]